MMIPERDDSNEVGAAGERFWFKKTPHSCSLLVKHVREEDDGPWTCYIRIHRGNETLQIQKTTLVNVTVPGLILPSKLY